MNWEEARTIGIAGAFIRREGWRDRFLSYRRSLWVLSLISTSTEVVQSAAVVQAGDFAAVDFNAKDWQIYTPSGINPNVPEPELLKGDKGDPGDKGEQGDRGEKGDTGEKGDKGDKGDPGADGIDGANGADGAPGAPGTPGTNGTNGVGVPAGGDDRAHLVKSSGADFATRWTATAPIADGIYGIGGTSVTIVDGLITNIV